MYSILRSGNYLLFNIKTADRGRINYIDTSVLLKEASFYMRSFYFDSLSNTWMSLFFKVVRFCSVAFRGWMLMLLGGLCFLSAEATPVSENGSSSVETRPSDTEGVRVDFFAGVDFNYRDQFHNQIYELLINLTPGVKWYMGHHWQLAAQALVPVCNDYGERYKKVRLSMATLSKEWNWNRRFFVKASGGLFGSERYGVDLKALWTVAPWLALDAQTGLTGFCSMAVDWECSRMERFTALAGVRVYLESVNTEFRARGGRFLYKDIGAQGEAMRHFRHCTVGVYAQYTDLAKDNYGFKIVMMIPPYQRSRRKVRFRTASNFRFTYNQQCDPMGAKMYTTDPEENEREGWFDRSQLDWGANRMQPDFKRKGGKE